MADRFPLIANSSANQIQELAASDNLNITSSLIVSSGIVTVSAPVDISKDIIVGAAATIAGVVDLNSTTDSTSSTTGALQIAGGVGIAKNVYIGAGLSIAGTLTYEDVTNVDSVGVITAKSGVNISGGELLVGSNIKGGTAGVLTATTFVGNLTGNVTGNASGSSGSCTGNSATATNSTNSTNSSHVLVTDNESTDEDNLITFVENGTTTTGNVGLEMDGNLYYNPSSGTLTATTLQGTLATAAQTSITSVGTLAGLTVNGGDGLKVGSALTFSSTSGIATFSGQVRFNDSASGAGGSPKLSFGYSDDLNIYHTGDDSIIKDSGTGGLYLLTSQFLVRNAAGNETCIQAVENGDVTLYSDNSARFATTGAGSTSVGISTVQDFSSVGMLKERVEIVANKVSAVTNINIEDGNIHYFTTNETGTATPNIRYSSNKQLNNAMLIGETISVTIIFKPNGAGYYAQLTIDGSAVTEEWNGGSAPSSASSGGYDVYTYSITKTADATFLVLANFSNFA